MSALQASGQPISQPLRAVGAPALEIADRRPVELLIEWRAYTRGDRDLCWHGRVRAGRRTLHPVRGPSRAQLLADMLDALLADGVHIAPCCALDGEGAH